ncbi:MAG: FAD-binding protein [Flavobacteriales bacterium]|nr:FAD-binding protein [Flavobacteriales bacterium]
MSRECTVRLAPEHLNHEALLFKCAAERLGIEPDEVSDVHIRKRSIDARKKPVYQLLLEVFTHGEKYEAPNFNVEYPNVLEAREVHIIGMGPAGMFAALRLIELGFKPIILERGKPVRERRRDLVKIIREQQVDPDSNYCFGEGGAGTYSDGKLYTRSGKRGSIKDVLKTLVSHGAEHDILVDAHPHIGTNKLPKIIENMREQILASGGEIHFDARVEDIVVEEGKVTTLKVNQTLMTASQVIVATGHSARDIFHMFHRNGWKIEAKTFALGVRIEHPQPLIDRIQYKRDRGEVLPPASYSLVCQVDGKGVYSFCMCPGGIIAPCATADGEVVTNGWSPSKRNNPYANSGMVVSVEPEEIEALGFSGDLGALEFQASIEKACCDVAGGKQLAPAQRLIDFIEGRKSKDLPGCSYQPGVVSVNLREVLPAFIADRLAEGFKEFGKRMKGFMTNDAILVGPESRTSSPVRIPRQEQTLEHPEVMGLFPCGEGAGYAGGIVSAAIDGQRVAAAIAEIHQSSK